MLAQGLVTPEREGGEGEREGVYNQISQAYQLGRYTQKVRLISHNREDDDTGKD